MERPTAADMLGPTLRSERTWRCVAYDRRVAVIALDRTADDEQLRLACVLHHALQRGVLVLL